MISSEAHCAVTREVIDTINTRSIIATCMVNTVVDICVGKTGENFETYTEQLIRKRSRFYMHLS